MTQTDQKLYETTGPGMNRRNFMRATLAAGGAAALGISATNTRYSPIGEAEAFAPLAPVVAAPAVAGATTWAIREVESWL